MKHKALCLLLALLMVLTLAACGSSGTPASSAAPAPSEADAAPDAAADEGASSAAADTGDKQVITVMHGTPDVNNPLHQYYIDAATRLEEKDPNVKVEFEIYDNETYKKKLQIYGSTNTMPDVFFVWANPSEFLPYVNAGVAAELDPADFADYGFTPGALDNATVDGKLVGLPMLIDYWYLYYNQKIFDDNGITVPKTIDELKTAIEQLNALGIAPVAMNGKDLWNQSVLFNDILLRFTGGDPQPIWDATAQVTPFSDVPEFTDAANAYKELVDMGMFQSSWTNDDAPTAKNLFQQGKAAMYYTGTWENSLVTEETTPEEVKEYINIIPFPSVAGKDSSTSLMGREGVTMMVAENSPNKEAAVGYLQAYFDPAYYPKACIEQGLGIPMQNFEEYVTDQDPPLIQEVARSINSATQVASHPFSFRLSAVFEQESKDLNMEFLLGQIDAATLWQLTDDLAKENQVE